MKGCSAQKVTDLLKTKIMGNKFLSILSSDVVLTWFKYVFTFGLKSLLKVQTILVFLPNTTILGFQGGQKN